MIASGCSRISRGLAARFPRAGRQVPEERDPAVREIIVEPYRVIYEINAASQTVDILRLWHAARGRPDV